MSYKKILLASAALFVVSPVSAADLGVKKPSKIEYLKICSTYGEGFFTLPGSNTCVQINGRVRAEYLYGGNTTRNDSRGGFAVLGRVGLDARTPSSYGDIKTVIRLQFGNSSGQGIAAQALPYSSLGNATTATGADFIGKASTSTSLDAAYIQFAGLTAGRTSSFFEFYANDINWYGIGGSDHGPTNLLAYTATFGDLAATISIEDPIARRQLVLDRTPIFGASSLVNYTFPGVGPGYGGSQMPDIVGVLRFEQKWGAAQLSGAIHQLTYALPAGFSPIKPSSDYGFALNGGLKVNLPFIAEGDALQLQVAYGKGASNYVTAGYCGQGALSCAPDSARNLVLNTDAVALPNGKTYLTQSYSVAGAFLHYWKPTVRQALFASYTGINYTSAANLWNSSTMQVGTNVVWSPVPNLDIGAEVQYNYVNSGKNIFAVNPGAPKSQDQIVSRVRVQRDF
jgi:Porin subfamily